MKEKKKYSVGKWVESWRQAEAQTLTFIVTEDCNLRCKYCYVIHKSSNAKMELETAKKFIDYIFSIKRPDQHAVILDFIGGEPLLEVKLMDEICDYFKYKAFELDDEWYWNYRISVCTNGVNYNSKNVQNFISKNYMKLSVTITIDGIREKHDMQRVFPDGQGSYDAVAQNIPLWLEKFEGSTKVTFASADLPLLKESIIHLWDMGITEIAANVVFEDVWKEGDDIIFENQLRELADHIIENDLYDKYKCTLFTDNIGAPESEESLRQTSCGAGLMLALGVDGKIYPCQRYYSHSLNKREGYVLGDVNKGLDMNKLRTFEVLMKKYQCDQECRECDVASGCMFCQGFSYDEADTKTNFQRAKYICKMHKARVRANNYYFAKLRNIKDVNAERDVFDKRLYFILQNNYVTFCSNENKENSKVSIMSENAILTGLKYTYKNFIKPIFLHSKEEDYHYLTEYSEYEILHIVPVEFFEKNSFVHGEEHLIVLQKDTIEKLNLDHNELKNVMLKIKSDEIETIGQSVDLIFKQANRIELNIANLTSQFDFGKYKKELEKCADIIIKIFQEKGEIKELSVLTDILWMSKHEGCAAGEKGLSYAPDEKIYICPLYYTEKRRSVGTLSEQHIYNKQLYRVEYFPICQECDAFQCERCVYLNEKTTGEVNVSPDFQCKKAHVERTVSLLIQKELEKEMKVLHHIESVKYEDPYENLKKSIETLGMYKI